MARRRSGGTRWWWLAPPLIGIAAYLAFDATLALLVSDEEQPADAPRAAARARAERPAPQAAALLPPADLAPAPSPTATGAQSRIAAPAGAARSRRAAPKAPRENLTEADRRALDKVLERTTEDASGR